VPYSNGGLELRDFEGSERMTYGVILHLSLSAGDGRASESGVLGGMVGLLKCYRRMQGKARLHHILFRCSD
jgi:hypothetical protein